MKRFLVLFRVVTLVIAPVAVSALADETSGPGLAGHRPGGHGLRHLEKCLSTLDLPSDQQTAIQSIFSNGEASGRQEQKGSRVSCNRRRRGSGDTQPAAGGAGAGRHGLHRRG